MNESGCFLAWELHSTYPTLCYKETHVPLKIRVLPSGILLQTLDFEYFATAYRSSKRVINLARESWLRHNLVLSSATFAPTARTSCLFLVAFTNGGNWVTFGYSWTMKSSRDIMSKCDGMSDFFLNCSNSLGRSLWCCLCDPTFSRFSRTPTCDGQTDTGPWLVPRMENDRFTLATCCSEQVFE